MAEEKINGSCVCGAVTYTISAPYMAFQYCHCSRCRKGTGSAHATNLFVKPEGFAWTAGEDKARRFELADAKYWCNGFCEVCGSGVPYLSLTGKAYIVPAGSLDGDPGERPKRSIYWGSRAPWYVHASELESFETFPQKK